MAEFVKTLKRFDDFFQANGVDMLEISQAEGVLGLKFSAEYKEYLLSCGVASADGHEFTGIIDSARLNVVQVTDRVRKRNPNIQRELYVVEELQIDDILIWQSEDGRVYSSSRDELPIEISSSLVDYINENVL